LDRTPVDVDGGDLVAFRRSLAMEEVERLEAMDRRRSMIGDVALLSKPAKLSHRYERDTWRSYRESIQGGQAGRDAYAAGRRPAAFADRPATPDTHPDRRRAVDRGGTPGLAGRGCAARRGGDLVAMGFEDEDSWNEELERRIEAYLAGRTAATERNQVGVSRPIGGAISGPT
jgi:hypothetical protein